ncbi:MAG: hypothetical protein K8S55_11910 [Phycisphaerae bacterium]|nr:hypothetical protein [Phycisphaerae bacterium]
MMESVTSMLPQAEACGNAGDINKAHNIMTRQKNIIAATTAIILVVQLLVPGGCGKPPRPTETKTCPVGADSPRALLDRMYSAVENNDPTEFHACHKIEGGFGELLKYQFDYLVTQSRLRKAAIAIYGEDVTATLKEVRGGIIFFDTSWFPEASIRENGDTAEIRGNRRVSGGISYTSSIMLKRIDGRWFLAPASDASHDVNNLKDNIRFVQRATILLRVVVTDVYSGRIKANELDERVEKDLKALFTDMVGDKDDNHDMGVMTY